MSQAALKVRERDNENNSSRPSNGSYLAGLIFFLMVIGTIVWGGLAVLNWMKDANRLPISKLVVTGERHYTTNDDIRQAILSLGQPGTFMTQDVNIIQQRIERMPWIRQVTVRKQWPDELRIHLVEYVPYARWNDSQMLDAEGLVFSIPAEWEAKSNFPMLYGPQGSEKEVLDGYRAMAKLLAANKLKLKVAAMTARRSWQLTLDNDIRLKLGRMDTTGRIKRFIELYPLLQQNTKKRVDYVDLRYDSGAAVGWAPLPIDAPNARVNGQ
ncbi:cell division protein FtsQ [Photorhabdus tasmaniensis]|uniref:Cell division protein FtsQ n=1 Tax=Photorhabdus tasmaniensis TaxID=1004159 RepID=A0ABX0GJ87_9GAMM|nr:cell division protein FtsQ [Photorhabdus tasmaniensis]NHB88587.1 cell division protein FtsQ [Photorhabdus tasmaniensis]